MSLPNPLKKPFFVQKLQWLVDPIGVAQQLVEAGVPKSDIVLGCRSPFVRQFTGFGVGVENKSEVKPLEGASK